MNPSNKIPLVILAALSSWSALFGHEVKVRVVDDQGRAVPEAHAKIIFAMIRSDADVEHLGVTDRNGAYSATGHARDSVYVEASKSGYYTARLRSLPKGKDLDLVAVMPRILNPVALYAKRSIVELPVQGEWLGFDFEAGDWVAPYGKGKTSDIQFKFEKKFIGYADSIRNLDEEIAISKRAYAARREEWTEEKFKIAAGKWDAELEISFPGEKEGLHEETRVLLYSELKFPHTAPEDGYVPTWHYAANTYTPRTDRENVGFFLRTRVKLDKDGNIVSANYAKVMREFRLSARGELSFAYYWNPTANDRNLEWNPKQNLLLRLTNEETPRDP